VRGKEVVIICVGDNIYMLHCVTAGVLPANQESTKFVWGNRERQFQDMFRGLTVMRHVSETEAPEMKLLKLYLVEQGKLPFKDDLLVG
jgi:hypothetical protein